ncbi:APC family permease [Streptococcus dysgalactiae]|uniref:APC family permease n=1 Tax=Streptococcus dysgalactiae subsp. dysgalactiae TaxID=99822 RepID=A0A9X7X932_STRDY|nr:APC family permease [Streptococcus dysgalactiae]MSU86634.1 APC family permease [Streptococcus dysgalactiae subsp. dysgalactiae]QGG98124.1 APC family permease [Streptococcus dysgalactiae subsp. dysgalactiae]QGH02838.1 APC family permease [Streptococcus dysgalactiae subsp. dysgalactiae]
MKKKLGFYSIVLLTINSIIGTGIFLSPGAVVAKSGDKALLVYSFAALFAAVLAITFAAAAKYVSKGGAAYAYTKAAFGDNWGFYVGITRYIAASIAWGVMGTGVVKTVLSILAIDNTNLANITIGFGCLMGLLLVINLMGTRIFELINNLSTLGKVGALVLTIVVGLGIVLFGHVNEFGKIHTLTDATGNALGQNLDLSSWVMAVIAAFYAFTGFESVASGSEDMEEPEKNLPRAIPLAIAIIAAIYIGIVGIAMMINPGAIVASTQVVALADVFANPFIRNMIVLGALISMFGINVAASFHTPRILEAMALQQQVPDAFAKRTDKGFPMIAFITTIGIAILLPMAFRFDMTSIIVLSSISRFIQFLIVPLAVMVFYFGKEKGEALQQVKKNVVVDVVIPAIALLLTIVLLYNFSWVEQFTFKLDNGQLVPNTFAIVAMVIGYVILPLGLMAWKKATAEKLNRFQKTGV